MNYGTYATIDCPTKKEDEAYDFLVKSFGALKAKVRREENPHDFGSYTSFEVDYPEEMIDAKDELDYLLNEIDFETTDEDSEDSASKVEDLENYINDWEEKAETPC